MALSNAGVGDSKEVVMAAEIATDDYLDNLVWASLLEARPEYMERHAGGARYRPEFAPFGAAQHYDAQSIAQIIEMVKPGERLAFFTPRKLEIPASVEIIREAPLYQMAASTAIARPSDARIGRLGAEDMPDMLKLVELTEPGPFSSRTNELGMFYGIRDEGQLVAMAGERMSAGKYVEVSAVCTHPDWRGKGLGRVMVEQVASAIQQRNGVPILHVFTTNHAAIGLYRELGFRVARTVQLTAMVRLPAQATR
jgi:ribosomal protein S18 acetylase RimI-like enzyme